MSVASFQGSKNVTTLRSLYGAKKINPIIAGTPKILPVDAKCENLHPAIIIIIEQIPIMTIELLKCGSNSKSPIIGPKNNICLKNPFPYSPNSSLFFINIPA